ncbi:Lipid A deacylase PagL [Cupriavidus laharis]|uniref:Lipid A deacylase n=1 Tax=Cupriavidus laharis TaxID=151654 RepID=A0ABN7YDC1_9BURK|nr:acyloxyacyl hydrolase [Cupriavidus laharis]CAG9170781.1 Lipid A deacylase PagL [Cupriavidus laharis]
MRPLPDDRPGCSAPVTLRCKLSPARCIRQAALATALSGAALGGGLAQAAPPIPAVQLGYGFDTSHDVQKVEAAFLWDSGFAWGNPQGLLLDLQWEVNVARWHSTSSNNPRNPWEFGFSPVARLAWKRYSWVPFLELSLGLRLMTETRSSDDHVFSTAFQFSEYAGVGVAFGKEQQFAVGYRFQHISNAGIKEPNPGTGFSTVYLRYRF